MLFAALLIAYLVFEGVCILCGLPSLARPVLRVIRQRLHGSKIITLPEELRIAAANGLLAVGSEMIVGTECEWVETNVKRFAIAPQLVGEAPGSIMEVLRLSGDSIELRIVSKARSTTNPTEQSTKS